MLEGLFSLVFSLTGLNIYHEDVKVERNRNYRSIMLAVLLLGAGLRFIHFDLMEFKADEVNAIRLTEYRLQHGLPTYGLMSGAGVRNPPGFIFLLLPVVGLTSSPLLIAAYITLFNLLAIWLIYRLGVALGSPRGGLWAAALMAAHPWLILYSRKIWAQSLLPCFVLLLLLVLTAATRRPRGRVIFWSGPILTLTWQIHYSAYCLLLFFAIWFLVQGVRGLVNRRAAAAGFLAGALLLLPYGSYLFRTGGADIRRSLEAGGRPGVTENILRNAGLWVKTGWAGDFGYPFRYRALSLSRTALGRRHPWLEPLAVFGTVLIFIFAGAGFRLRSRREGRTPLFSRPVSWLALLAILPLILYSIKGIRAPPHYFIVSLPALLMLAGLGVEEMSAFIRSLAPGGRIFSSGPRVAAGLLSLIGAAVWLSFILFINRTGGTAGSYGLAFRVQRAAADYLAGQNIYPGNIDARLTRDDSIGIRYLQRGCSRSRAPRGERKARLIDTLLFPGEGCSPGEKRAPLPPGSPLRICISSTGSGNSQGEE